MDNLSCHEVAGVREAITGAGCRLEYLPAHSPDRNPIENAFGEFKALFRTTAARTVDAMYGAAMRDAVGRFGADGCRNDIRHCGYPAATPT